MEDLGTLGGDESHAYGVSADGSVVVGTAHNSNWYWRAFRWTRTAGMRDLGVLNDWYSIAYGVSADGLVVVGESDRRAFRWTRATGMRDLRVYGAAYGISANGSVVVGTFEFDWDIWHAFRWTAAMGIQDLGTLGGVNSVAYSASSDGAIVVGTAQNADEQWRAFRWTLLNNAMEDLNTTYANLLTGGSYLSSARAISPDGRYIVGYGWNANTRRNEAFLLDTQPGCTAHSGDVDNNGCVDDADLLAVLFAFGNTGSNLGRVDVNCDEVVDDADLLQVLFSFGSGC
jgi:probable HAF family extracellular repeat protein